MALDMFLELEGENPDWSSLALAARKSGVEDLQVDPEKSFVGRFAKSGMGFWLSAFHSQPKPISAEGEHGCHFLTRCSICFRINNACYDESVSDLENFLAELAALSPMQFVLSFQFEEVRARNCGGISEFFWLSGR